MRLAHLSLLSLCVGLFGLSACGSDDKKQDPTDKPSAQDMAPDIQGDMTPDIAPEDMNSDASFPVNDEPKGLVYLNDPITNNRMTSEVILPKPGNPEGRLTNDAVNVLNCINEKGTPFDAFNGMSNYLCKEVQTARPAKGGDYLHIKPPMEDTNPRDPFSEVQMYHHVNVIYDYFKNGQSVSGLKRIDALTNFQLYYDGISAALNGGMPGWYAFNNAAYFFPDAFERFDLPSRPEGAIVFGQGTRTDFSYDASVIYHEYTHAIIGPDRFQETFTDKYGLNNTARAINEGLADYFAASILEVPFIGRYGLKDLGLGAGRDFGMKLTCPGNLTTAIHEDGKIMASYLWAVRGELGKEITDRIVLSALNTSIAATGFDQFVQILLMTAQQQSPMAKETFERIAGEFGLLECERAVEWTAWTVNRIPITVVGTKQLMGGNYPDGVPGYFQHWVEVPAGKAVQLSWIMKREGQLELALSHNTHAEMQSGPQGTSVNATHMLNGIESKKQFGFYHQTVTIDSSCLSQDGKTYIMFLNKQENDANITSRAISVVDANNQPDLRTCNGPQ